jgi:hypothetical protein
LSSGFAVLGCFEAVDPLLVQYKKRIRSAAGRWSEWG